MLTFTWSKGWNEYKIGIPWTWFITGWILMIVLGILHLNVLPAIPALSYGYSCLITFTMQIISVLHSD